MNVICADQLMVAADQQGDQRLRDIDRRPRKEIQGAAPAGSVEMATKSSAARLAPLTGGLTREERVPIQRCADSCATTRLKWENKFAEMRRNGLR